MDDLAQRAVELLTKRGETVAVAESLTGGMVCAAITAIPGASVVLRGGVVAYATELKATLLGVSPELLEERGPVDPDVAVAMAHGARIRCGATYGLATTGVAGPDSQGGFPPGTVHVAVVSADGSEFVRTLHLSGDRASVRATSVAAALELLMGAADTSA
ncbi:MAG: CinA family protein [Actinobacteria bacterium]|nr:CinA family protein [Actinomycetota bacterium]